MRKTASEIAETVLQKLSEAALNVEAFKYKHIRPELRVQTPEDAVQEAKRWLFSKDLKRG